MRRFAWTVGLVLVLIGSAMPAAAMEYSLLTEHKISPESLSQMLEAGSMLLVDYDENGNMRLITSAIAIDAPPEQVLAAINDFEHFPEFMPSTRSVEVVGREGDQTLVSFEIVFKFSVFTQKVRYVHRQHEVPGKGYWWELESGDLGASVGSWEVVPLDGGKRSAAVYSIYTDIRPWARSSSTSSRPSRGWTWRSTPRRAFSSSRRSATASRPEPTRASPRRPNRPPNPSPAGRGNRRHETRVRVSGHFLTETPGISL